MIQYSKYKNNLCNKTIVIIRVNLCLYRLKQKETAAAAKLVYIHSSMCTICVCSRSICVKTVLFVIIVVYVVFRTK